jgi:hypothetical protein
MQRKIILQSRAEQSRAEQSRAEQSRADRLIGPKIETADNKSSVFATLIVGCFAL